MAADTAYGNAETLASLVDKFRDLGAEFMTMEAAARLYDEREPLS